MAAELGIKQQQYARYEKGITVPGIDMLEDICRTHACSADWLLGLKEHSGVSINASDGAAVAIGSGANASVGKASRDAPRDCKKCPYKAVADKLKKAGIAVPGV